MHQARFISVVITDLQPARRAAAVVEACFTQSDTELRDHHRRRRLDRRHPRLRRTRCRRVRRCRCSMYGNRTRASGWRWCATAASWPARGDYIVILDGDCVPQRDFVAQHRKLAERGYMVRQPGAARPPFTKRVSGRTHRPAVAGQPMAQLRLRAAGHINKALQLMVQAARRGAAKAGASPGAASRAATWRPGADLDLVNGFDESFRGWGHEDADFVVRLFNAGVMRKDGAFSTEVFHLWHRESSRDEADSNKKVVRQRALDATVLATRGLRQTAMEKP
jgi:hypothetical protein